ncbi:MAG: response regulator [Anaerolineae bacterium]|nr:response regulator [Anaerolineae bacterium]
MTKILIIDGDANSRNEIVNWLIPQGYEALSAGDGRSGVEHAIRYRPDLIVCDITIPRLDGYGVLLEIRANPVTGNIPFIFLIANSSYEDIRYGASFGIDDYITKPFTDSDFLQAVQSRLEKKAAQESDHQREVDFLRDALAQEHELRLLKAKLVAMFAHDFRNPLANILFSNSLLRDYADHIDENRRLLHMNRIDASVRQLVQMLDEMLILAKIESGKLQFEPKMLNAEQVLQPIVEEFRAIYSETYHLIFENHFPGIMNIDPRLLREIITNLLSNAIKYSPLGSKVHVTLGKQGGELKLTVQDQGIGILEADQSRVFEAFERGSNTGNRSGTGLGLAIVKQAVDLHGGSIQLKSEVGTGTLITVNIPDSSV